jgi:hypothetical protein
MQKRRSIFKAQSRKQFVALEPRDLAVFEVLTRYRYLTRDFIHALLPAEIRGGEFGFRNRFVTLHHEGFLSCPRQQFSAVGAHHRKAVYELGHRGAQAIGAPRTSYNGSFPHELMVNFVRALIEIGVNANPEFRLISFEELLAHPNCPSSTRERRHPETLPLSRGEITADWQPFGIERTLPDGHKRRIFCPGFEADCGTEAIQRAVLKGSSIYRKLVEYNEVIDNKIHERHFGVHSFLVPFVTTSKVRMHNMIAKTRMAGNAEHFVFTYLEGFNDFERVTEPRTDFLTMNWDSHAGSFSFASF